MLRELIYVDTDKVRSLLAQMDGSVTEDLKVTEKKQGSLSGGMRNVASREQVWGSEESAQRSLADAVFPTLEDALTSHVMDCKNKNGPWSERSAPTRRALVSHTNLLTSLGATMRLAAGRSSHP
jgi:hypothetical protein